MFSSHAWQLCLRSRLGLQLGEPIESGAIPRLCPGCQVPMDNMGDHALCCPKLGTYARHNDLRNQFTTLCMEIGLRVEMEVSPPGTSSRPADVLLHGLDTSTPLAVDFSVVHPLQMSQNLAEVHPGKFGKDGGKEEDPRTVCNVSQGVTRCHTADVCETLHTHVRVPRPRRLRSERQFHFCEPGATPRTSGQGPPFAM